MNKKVLFIHHGKHAGGAPMSLLYTALGVREHDYAPTVGLVQPSERLRKLYNDHGIPTIDLPYIPLLLTWSASEGKRWNPIMWYGLFKAAVRWKEAQRRVLAAVEGFDLVHLNSVSLSNVAAVLTENGKPFVWHVREQGPRHQGYRYKFIQSRLVSAPAVIFLSEAERRSWFNELAGGFVVHNFVDFSTFSDGAISQAAARETLGIDPGATVILYVGGLKKHKGIETFVRGIGQMAASYPEAVYLMPDSLPKYDAGGEIVKPYEQKIIDMMRTAGVLDQSILTDFDAEVAKYFAAADIVVFPATVPHFARPVVEAGAMKTPVLVSDLPVLDEIVEHGLTGYLYEEGNSGLLAEYLEKLMSNPELRKSLGKNAFQKAHSEFNYEIQVDKIVTIYEEVLKN